MELLKAFFPRGVSFKMIGGPARQRNEIAFPWKTPYHWEEKIWSSPESRWTFSSLPSWTVTLDEDCKQCSLPAGSQERCQSLCRRKRGAKGWFASQNLVFLLFFWGEPHFFWNANKRYPLSPSQNASFQERKEELGAGFQQTSAPDRDLYEAIKADLQADCPAQVHLQEQPSTQLSLTLPGDLFWNLPLSSISCCSTEQKWWWI